MESTIREGMTNLNFFFRKSLFYAWKGITRREEQVLGNIIRVIEILEGY